MYTPKISVIIPFYNRIALTLQSLQSALSQNYPNMEVLLINDGSSEDLSPLVTFISHYPTVRLLSIPHSGTSKARNTGLYYAQGEYIAFLDSDDFFQPGKLQIQMNFMLTYGYAFCHTSYDEITMNGDYIKTQHSGRLQGWVLPTVRSSCPIATPTVMVKKTSILNKVFPEKYQVAEDICFWIDMAYEYPLGGLDLPLSAIRISNSTTKLNTSKLLEGQANVLEYLRIHPHYNVF